MLIPRGCTLAIWILRQNVRETDSAYTVALAANALLADDLNDVSGRKLLAGLQSSFRGDGRLGWVGSYRDRRHVLARFVP